MVTVKNVPNSDLTLELKVKRWSVAEYHRISELGILDADGRTELIEGEILLMAAKVTAHTITLRLLASLLDEIFDRDTTVSIITQDPIQLNDLSEPEPDLVIVKGTILDYASNHPCPEDIYLVVEVADSTLRQDCQVKDKHYARAGIVEYWVVDIQNRQLNIFRNPTETGYTERPILSEPNSFSPLAFPQISIDLSSILPPIA
jgi:Uma2 family endonuclease